MAKERKNNGFSRTKAAPNVSKGRHRKPLEHVLHARFELVSGFVVTTAMIFVSAALTGCDKRVSTPPVANQAQAEIIRNALDAGIEAGVGGTSATPTENPTGYASLRGIFRINGTPPPNPQITNVKEPDVCAPGGVAIYNERLVVEQQSNAIANVLVFLPKIRAEWVHESASGKTDEIVFDQKQCVFSTRVVAMQSTQTLKMINSDPTGHNTKLQPRRNPSFDQTIPSRASTIYRPGAVESEPFSISCAIHPWMKAWMIVRDNAYFSVTRANGSFEIANLPAGVELQFRAWHEAAGRSGFLQNVTVNGEQQKWSKGRFKLTLEPDTAYDLEVVIDASEFE